MAEYGGARRRSGTAGAPAGPPGPGDTLADLADPALREVDAPPGSVLAGLLRRVRGQDPDPDPFVTGHAESL
ncbi:hypothetical protein ACN20G_30325 (plasmid) [Streptomyces sp. BI20]|uniref:hypothetical protein n=1 Tax=Streptomyces sp. BI20 TaxID=3403460 RepID=UPI003C75C824